MGLPLQSLKALGSLLAPALIVTACGSGPVSQQAPQQAAPGTTTTAPPPPKDATIGQSITLNDRGQPIQVTVNKLINPLTVPYESGNFAAVQLTFKNLSQSPWRTDPDLDGTLITDAGQQGQFALTSDSSCPDSSNVTLTPGSSQTTCIAFKVTDGQNPAKFQTTLGFGNAFGQWDLTQEPAAQQQSSTPTTQQQGATGNAGCFASYHTATADVQLCRESGQIYYQGTSSSGTIRLPASFNGDTYITAANSGYSYGINSTHLVIWHNGAAISDQPVLSSSP
jgi:hypothetical protein